MTKKILIYSDEGVSQDSVNALLMHFKYAKCVAASDLQKTHWMDKTTLLIIPGGRSLPFYQSLGFSGNKNIISFVKQGGCYLGFCAGAYYASQNTVFAKNLPLALNLSGELNFFKGSAIGPVFANKAFT